ncbi:MAG: porin [Gallionella sp.]|nr:porin [Gallionella sp.]
MQKKIIALAIAAAFSAPAFADTSNVTVYGVLNADVEQVKNSIPSVAAGNSTATSLNRVNSNASRFGIKGSEDLGDGLKAIFQIESRVNLVGNELTSGTNAGTAGVFNGIRNSNVGLKGNFGTVFVGVWDTPFKTAHNAVEMFDNTTIATATALMGVTTATAAASGTAYSAVAYTLRQNSSVQYWTPVMSGFQGKLAYSTANGDTYALGAASGVALQTAANKPSLTSLSVAYDVDQFYAAYAYDQHSNFRTQLVSGAGLKDTGHRLVGAYKFAPGAQVGLAYDRLTVASTTAGIAASTRAAWELSGKYAFGANNVGAFYTKAGSMGNTNATGAKQVSLRYGYNFSKRTEAYALYTSIKNDTNAAYGIADVANGVVPLAGSKISGFGLGVAHSF